MEDYAYVIDIVPFGDKKTGGTLVYLVGLNYTLLTAKAKEDNLPKVGEKIYIGKDLTKREKIEKIRARITFNQLTEAAKENLLEVLKKIVEEKEEMFIMFLNRAGPISRRTHQLDFIPGLGKKGKEKLLKARNEKPFENFEDVKNRVPVWTDPVKSFAQRIYDELSGKERIRLFVFK